MGGRGANGGVRSGSAGNKTSFKSYKGSGTSDYFEIPKLSKADVATMNRSQLETFATAIFANDAVAQGLSIQEGVHRAKSLMSGNTTAQLRKYVLKYGKK